MKTLHILRSEPDDRVRMFIEELSRGNEIVEFSLYRGEVDYDRLVEAVFASEQIFSWW